MHEQTVSSVAQDQWSEICAAVRVQLARQVRRMPAMNAEEVALLVDAIDTAMWCELKAGTYDEALEQRRQELIRQAAYGG